jgi:acyl-CoA synthetase (AMP-forming)/AMP-acid ligase II
VYGLTEASPVLTQTDQRDPTDDPAESVGRPLPGTEVAVRDPATGCVVGPGTVGEVIARGPQLMDGYVGDPAATSRAIDADGWLHTGDLGWLDTHGRLHVEGRADDMVERDGRRWLPGPVERALTALPGVADAVVVNGGPSGREVVAFVRPHPGHRVDEHVSRGTVATACGADSRLDRVVVVDELPALPSGKVRRFVLRDWASSLQG